MMSRTVKKPEERKLEIIQTAEKLFGESGYSKTSVESIIKEMGVAKGTFYYYFKSKEDVLEAIVDNKLDQLVKMAQEVADDTSMDALTKMQILLSDSHIGDEDTDKDTKEIVEHLHLPANRELHEISNIQSVLRLSPILARIVEQGNEEKAFNTKWPLETIQFLFTGSKFLMDSGLFDFSEQEIINRRIVMQEIIEKALGAKRGTFDFMNNNLSKGDKNE